MEKGNKAVQGILIFLIFVCIICFAIGYLRAKLHPTVNPTPENNTEENTNQNTEEEEPKEEGEAITYDELMGGGYTLAITGNKYDAYKKNDSNTYYVLSKSDNKVLVPQYCSECNADASVKLYSIVEPENETIYGVFNTKYNVLTEGYDDYSCIFHSDVRSVACTKSDTTIISRVKNEKATYGLISLVNNKVVIQVDYDKISETADGNFIASKSNKKYLFSSTGKQLLNGSYDQIEFNKDLGYICINGTTVIVYDTKLKEVKSPDLNSLYQEALNKTKENEPDATSIPLQNSTSYNFSGGGILVKTDVSNAYSEEGINFSYKGSTFSGEKLVIYNTYEGCYNTPYIYIIDGNKANKISGADLVVNTEELGCF